MDALAQGIHPERDHNANPGAQAPVELHVQASPWLVRSGADSRAGRGIRRQGSLLTASTTGITESWRKLCAMVMLSWADVLNDNICEYVCEGCRMICDLCAASTARAWTYGDMGETATWRRFGGGITDQNDRSHWRIVDGYDRSRIFLDRSLAAECSDLVELTETI